MVVCICEQTSNDRVEMLIPDENGLLEFYVSAVSIVRNRLTAKNEKKLCVLCASAVNHKKKGRAAARP